MADRELYVVCHDGLGRPLQGKRSDFLERCRRTTKPRHYTPCGSPERSENPICPKVAYPCAMPAPDPSNRLRRRQAAISVRAASRISDPSVTAGRSRRTSQIVHFSYGSSPRRVAELGEQGQQRLVTSSITTLHFTRIYPISLRSLRGTAYIDDIGQPSVK